jgi:hypothetical protein
MSRFRDVELAWGGKQYTLPSNKLMAVIMRIEDIITLPELVRAMQLNKPPMAKIASAYAEVLRYVGCDVKDEDVYAGLFDGTNGHVVAAQSVAGLLQLMSPPADADIPFGEEKDPPVGNAVTPSSRKPTKRRSGAAG